MDVDTSTPAVVLAVRPLVPQAMLPPDTAPPKDGVVIRLAAVTALRLEAAGPPVPHQLWEAFSVPPSCLALRVLPVIVLKWASRTPAVFSKV